MHMTVQDLRDILYDYDDEDIVLFVEHQYRGPSSIYRADDNHGMSMQRHYTYKPGLGEPQEFLIFNLTHVAMSNDYESTTSDPLEWPGKST